MKTKLLTTAAVLAVALPLTAQAQETIPVGHIVDFTGATSDVGVPFGGGIRDAMNYINSQGGVNGKMLEFESIDYAYQAPRAVSTYRRLVSQNDVVAVQGWGTADTEALVDFVKRDQIPYWSASYSGTLTDPVGDAPRSTKSAPFNFFYGPSYSDGCRGLVAWGMADWQAKGNEGAPKFVHMGDNHPFPNSPKAACAEYAEELGYEVLDPINYTLAPGDFTPQCLALQQVEADYAYLANTGGSGISLLNACSNVGVDTQFLAGVWGFDENVMRAAGAAANGVAFVMRTGTTWTGEAPGMEVVRGVSELADPEVEYRPIHYLVGICSAYYMKEAMEWADANGGITGENIRLGMYAMSAANDMAWVPAGTEGVCAPHGWADDDHRGTMQVNVYRGVVSGSTDGMEVAELIEAGTIAMEPLQTIDLPRRPEWLGY